MMEIKAVYANTEHGRVKLTYKEKLYAADGIRVSVTENEKDGVRAYTVQAQSDTPFDAYSAIELHIKAPQNARFTSNHRHCEYWCKPVFSDRAADIPKQTQCLLFESSGVFFCMLPVCSAQYLAQIKGVESGDICVYMQSLCAGMQQCDGLAFTVAAKDAPYRLIERCAAYAVELLQSGIPLRTQRRYPDLFEYLGWCSWDAFMTAVSEEKLLQKCEEFKAKRIPVKWAIIDDMWGDVPGLEGSVGVKREDMFRVMHASKLASFKADAKRFPNGLSACVSKMNAYGMKVGMWHPTTGYWKGITPDGEIAKEMPDALITAKRYWGDNREPTDEILIPAPTFEKAFKFYDAWHRYLKHSGVDFVKVDNQSYVHGVYRDILPLGEAARDLHKAIEHSTAKHFDNALINCMGAAAENMWNRPESAVSRCSDDFQPENRDWFTKHLLQCSYNCLVQGVFHVCDWDMWWTDDSQAIKNAVLRAISGGPIYISDTLDRSRAEILKPLCFDDGRILRTDRPATPISRCITTDPEKSGAPFIIWSSGGDGALVAAFNLDSENKAVDGHLTFADIPTLRGEKFAVYEYFSKAAFVADRQETIRLSLTDRDDCKLYTIVPMQGDVTFIGLADKMNSAKAILRQNEKSALVYQGGEIAFVSEKDIQTVTVNGETVTPVRNGVVYTVSVSSSENVLMEIPE